MMNTEKINGYTKEEAKALIDYIAEGKKNGKALSYLFASFGKEHGRAKGSVRNYYYTLLKQRGDERVVRLLDGTNLSVDKIYAFTPAETDEALKSILTEKAKGMSVRKAIQTVAAGDDKLMLRLQNKYRNLLKKEPERVKKMAQSLGIEEPLSLQKSQSKSFLQRRLEEEINALLERLLSNLTEENAKLKERIKYLQGKGE